MSLQLNLLNEHATAHIAARLARVLPAGVVYLWGDLGAGKTTLTRAWLHALGHVGAVKSPTYTLVEPYQIGAQPVYHFDLYRLQDPFELELMGIRDYVDDPAALLLIEWPQKGEPVIPAADVVLHLLVDDDEITRHLTISAQSSLGETALTTLRADYPDAANQSGSTVNE
jgi:tRNA threonylcarbamoyladenosine biosynthesis protein TsaE